MPEGPECHHITDCLQSLFADKQLNEIVILSGRYQRHGPFSGLTEFNNLLPDNVVKVTSINCHGKFIYWKFNNDYSLWNTLGMSGQWTTTFDKHCHVQFNFVDNLVVYFRDIRNFGTLLLSRELSQLEKRLKKLGSDILSEENLEMEQCLNIFYQRKDWNICKFLMDQRYFSGVGNYLKTEALYLSKTNPFSLIKDLSDKQLYLIYQSIKEISKESYQSKGASFQTFQDPDSNKGQYSLQFKVYGQKMCEGYPVKREKTPDNRSTYWVSERCE